MAKGTDAEPSGEVERAGSVVDDAPVRIMPADRLDERGRCRECGERFPHRGSCSRSVMRSGAAWIPPDMADELRGPQRYTLEEARAELARQDCRVYGHDFDVIATYSSDGGPSDVVCSRCSQAWTLAPRSSVFEVLDGAMQTIAVYSNRDAAEKHALNLRAQRKVADVEESAVKDTFDGWSDERT